MPDAPVPRPEVVAWLYARSQTTGDRREVALYRAALRDVEAMGALEARVLENDADLWETDGEFVMLYGIPGAKSVGPTLADAILAAAAPPGAEP